MDQRTSQELVSINHFEQVDYHYKKKKIMSALYFWSNCYWLFIAVLVITDMRDSEMRNLALN